jgi:hypothetical protein
VEWGLLVIGIIVLFIAYAIVQETRAQMHWRGLVAQGDVEAIRSLLEEEVQTWRSERVPKGVPSLLWHGVQTVELTDVNPRGCRVNCSTEGEYALVGGKRVETSSPLVEGMKLTMKLADLILYDVPNVKLDYVQVDVYTSFRDEAGRADPRCIVSSLVRRADVQDLDWEETPPREFINSVGGRYAAEPSGLVRAVEPLPWPPEVEVRA